MINNLMGMLQNMDEEDARDILDQLDDEQMQEGIRRLMDMYLVPHLDDIREEVKDYPDPMEVRETYQNAPETRQQQLFDEAVQDLLVTADLIRERPPEGFRRLKQYLRDPTTTEALLLIFENEAIQPSYRDQLKDYSAKNLHYAGVFLLPEMYEEQEVKRVLDVFDVDYNR